MTDYDTRYVTMHVLIFIILTERCGQHFGESNSNIEIMFLRTSHRLKNIQGYKNKHLKFKNIWGCVWARYLGDRDRLLLHNLMDSCPVAVHHFVELVDATHALVSQHEGATLQHHLAGQRVLHYGRSQPDPWWPPPSRVLTCHRRTLFKHVCLPELGRIPD